MPKRMKHKYEFIDAGQMNTRPSDPNDDDILFGTFIVVDGNIVGLYWVDQSDHTKIFPDQPWAFCFRHRGCLSGNRETHQEIQAFVKEVYEEADESMLREIYDNNQK